MLTVSKDKPTVVMIVVSLEDNSQSETRYISGKTVPEVVAELFGEKPEKFKKPRAKRRSKEQIAADKKLSQDEHDQANQYSPKPKGAAVTGPDGTGVATSAAAVEKKGKREKAIWA